MINLNLKVKIYQIQLQREGKKYTRQVYTILDLGCDIGGLIDIALIVAIVLNWYFASLVARISLVNAYIRFKLRIGD